MDNNLSNKKILLIGLIVFLLITGGIVAIVYWPKTHIDGLDISPEAVKAKCLEDANKMTDDELIDEIKNLKNPHEILSSVGEERIHFANKQIINYLICKVSNDKNEETYNRAKNFIEELDIQEESKRNSLAQLSEIYNISSNAFIDMFALGPIESICEGSIVQDEVLEGSRTFWEDKIPLEMIEERQKNIKEICDIINKYTIDPSSFIEVEIKDNWPDNELVLQNSVFARSALAFRLGGEELAQEVCRYIPDRKEEFKEDCREYVYYLSNIQQCIAESKELKDCIMIKKCNEFKQNIINMICDAI